MITVYEIKPNGFLGEIKQIDPKEGVGINWTYTAPKTPGINQWIDGEWHAKSEEPNSTIVIDPQNLASLIREKRNELLVQTDWTQVLDSPVDRQDWAIYRQSLRDITSQPGFPTTVIWPEKPI